MAWQQQVAADVMLGAAQTAAAQHAWDKAEELLSKVWAQPDSFCYAFELSLQLSIESPARNALGQSMAILTPNPHSGGAALPRM